MKKEALDPLVEEIVKQSVKPVITVSVREIARLVEEQTGFTSNPSEIWYSLQRLGIVPNGKNGRHGFAWRHNEPK